MQRVMMMPVFRSCRAMLPLSLMALVVGCAAQPTRPASQPVPLNALTIMPSDLQKAEREAYNQGFEAGQRYQRKHDQQAASAPQPDTALPAVQPPPPSDVKTPAPVQAACPPQAAAKPPDLTPLPPLPPSSSYTTSGPAQPLSQ